jgi:hypothetical protein
MLIKHDDTERVFDKHIHAPKIKKIYNASRHELLPEELGETYSSLDRLFLSQAKI